MSAAVRPLDSRITNMVLCVRGLRRDLASAAAGDALARRLVVNRYRNCTPRAGWAAWLSADEIAQIEALIEDEGRRR